jgi:Lon protease-like protein
MMSATITSDLPQINKFESILSCPICLDLYYRPISLPCGHTLCKICLCKATKLKSCCPVCRQFLPYSSGVSFIAENVVINNILTECFADYPEYCGKKSIEYAELADPVSRRVWSGPLFAIPVFIVPKQSTTLYLFERRYLELYDIAMQGDRMFCIHMNGQIGEYGMIVEILSSTRHQSGSITCNCKGVVRCKFTEHAVILNQGFGHHRPLFKVFGEIIEDGDNETTETELTYETRGTIASLRSLIRNLEPYLSVAQRESLEYMYGDANAALSGRWQDLSYWMLSAFRLNDDLKRELLLAETAVQRIERIYRFCLDIGALPEPGDSTAATIIANALFAVGREKSHLATTWKVFLGCVIVVGVLVGYLVQY